MTQSTSTMLSPSSLAFLKRLLDTPAPSGFEGPAARVWREEAATFAENVTTDVAGNSMAEINPGGSPTIMLDGHIDEIGVIVQYIDDDGFVYVAPIGGWDPQVLVGQRIRFLGRDGDVIGVVGKKPIHLMKAADREHASKMTDLWVDIGASNRAEAEGRLSVGDPRRDRFEDDRLPEQSHRLALDRRSHRRVRRARGVASLRAESRPARVVAAATTQEEIAWHGGGALVCTNCINPQMAIVVDVTFATDHPSIEKKEIGDHQHRRRARAQPRRDHLAGGLRSRSAARPSAQGIKYSVHAAGRDTSTNADAIHIAREGVATGLVSIPNRYMHSPNEMVSLDDVDKTATLLADVCREVTAKTDFTAR